ncbi:hypothetical protein EDC01DRAFT_634010 [Geopyxis carbonaria]|nr:hypothetical protein EDC01DRAFT_634010 [Geopyxis carbonaria]
MAWYKLDWALRNLRNYFIVQTLARLAQAGLCLVVLILLKNEWFSKGDNPIWSIRWLMACSSIGVIYTLFEVLHLIFFTLVSSGVICQLLDAILVVLNALGTWIAYEYTRPYPYSDNPTKDGRYEVMGTNFGLMAGQKRKNYAKIFLIMESVLVFLFLYTWAIGMAMRQRENSGVEVRLQDTNPICRAIYRYRENRGRCSPPEPVGDNVQQVELQQLPAPGEEDK